MSKELLAHRIERAKELLETVRHAAMATVNPDGTPHNTPYLFLYDETIEHLYWSSHLESQHSKNIKRTGQIFVVVYEANVGGGLYIQADKAHVATNKELDQALTVHNTFRAKQNKAPLEHEFYTSSLNERMYVAKTQKFWVNLTERDENGHIIRDYRHEISREQLL